MISQSRRITFALIKKPHVLLDLRFHALRHETMKFILVDSLPLAPLAALPLPTRWMSPPLWK